MRSKESTYFSEVEKTIEQIRSEAQASQPAAAKAEVPRQHARAPFTHAARAALSHQDLTRACVCGNREWTLAIRQGGLLREHQVPHVHVVAVLAPHPALLHQALAR
jgi:hypothetical protein